MWRVGQCGGLPGRETTDKGAQVQTGWVGGCVCVDVCCCSYKCTGYRYNRLEIDKSLCDNLRRKIVVEFPTLHVVLREKSNIQATSEWAAKLSELVHCTWSI